MNIWEGMCHWEPEPLAHTKTSSISSILLFLQDQTRLKLFFETISL